MKLGDPTIQSQALAAARTYLATLAPLPPQSLTHCSMHWAATPYGWARQRKASGDVIPYQVVSDRDATGKTILVAGMDPKVNARAIPQDERPDIDYCASVWHRNSHGVAVSISAMLDAGPRNFGVAPIDAALVEFMCAGAAALCAKYGIDASDPQTCFTHAEAACWDNYFLGDDPDCRWDLSILEASTADTATLKANAPVVGKQLRDRVRAYKVILMKA